MPAPPDKPPLAAPTTFRDDEIRVAEWLVADALKRNAVVARSAAFASLARKMKGLRVRVEQHRALRRAHETTAVEAPSVEAGGEAGSVDGPTMARRTEPSEPIPGDPEPRRRGRPPGRRVLPRLDEPSDSDDEPETDDDSDSEP